MLEFKQCEISGQLVAHGEVKSYWIDNQKHKYTLRSVGLHNVERNHGTFALECLAKDAANLVELFSAKPKRITDLRIEGELLPEFAS